jgi:ParB-like chromosome segregation protein Spo0J
MLGWKEIAIVRTPLVGSEATAYAIADNRTAELAEWDDTALAETLRAMQSEDFELAATGFDAAEVDAMIASLGNEILGPEVNGKEYDESVADSVEYLECPACQHRWPK